MEAVIAAASRLRVQRMRASRSASSSHWLAARRTSSLAGRPFGNRLASSASRLTLALRGTRVARLSLAGGLAAACARVGRRRLRAPLGAVLVAVVFPPAPAARRERAVLVLRVPLLLALRARLRRARAALTAPTTPCAWRRCAPKAAARLNVRPHSGQTNSPVLLLFGACGVVAIWFLAILLAVAA